MARKTVMVRIHADLKDLLENSKRLGVTGVGRSKVLAEFAKANGFPDKVAFKRVPKRTRRKARIVIRI